MKRMNGRPPRKSGFLILCLNRNIPARAPKMPKADIINRVFSEMRYLFLKAFSLSAP